MINAFGLDPNMISSFMSHILDLFYWFGVGILKVTNRTSWDDCTAEKKERLIETVEWVSSKSQLGLKKSFFGIRLLKTFISAWLNLTRLTSSVETLYMKLTETFECPYFKIGKNEILDDVSNVIFVGQMFNRFVPSSSLITNVV